MPRVKRGVTAHAKHKKVIRQAKGFRGRRGNVFNIAKEAVMKAQQYAYRDRKQRKRQFRGLWIARINAAVREHGDLLDLHAWPEESFDRDRSQVGFDLAVADKTAFAQPRRPGQGQAGRVTQVEFPCPCGEGNANAGPSP
jgi:large subunit ribosomal protein L20